MFDLNAVINAAINNAVDARIGEIQAAYANKMGEMAQAISVLQDRLQSIEGVNRQLLGASNGSVEVLNAHAKNIIDLQRRLDSAERAAQILNSHADSLLGLDSLRVRFESLENTVFDLNGNPRSRKSLDEDDVRGIVASLFAEEGEYIIEDAFETLVDRQDVITKDKLEEQVREVLENASITLSVT